MDISISRGLPLAQVENIKESLRNLVYTEIPEAELSITMTAVALNSETIHQRVNIIAANLHLPIHHVTIHQIKEKISISLDLEVEGTKSLKEGHDLATRLEEEIIRELGDNIEIETHIEPLQIEELEGKDVAPSVFQSISENLTSLAASGNVLKDIHDIRVRQTDSGLIIIFHCLALENLSVDEVHEALDALERATREKYPEAARVIGHAEPIGYE